MEKRESSPQTVYRQIKPSDAAEIFNILEECHRDADVPIGPRWGESQVFVECGYGGWVRLGECDRIEAFILVRDTGAAWEISFLATIRESRKKGMMLDLLHHLISLRPSDRPLWLEVHEKNEAARRMYEKAGFVRVGRRPRYYSDGGAAILYNYG